MTNIEDLRARVKLLLAVLDQAEPGLSTWRENYEHAAANVLAFWGYGQTASLLMPVTPPPSIITYGCGTKAEGNNIPVEHCPIHGYDCRSGFPPTNERATRKRAAQRQPLPKETE